jgi:hypothetical protein
LAGLLGGSCTFPDFRLGNFQAQLSANQAPLKLDIDDIAWE